MGGPQFLAEGVQAVGAAGGQRQVTTQGGEPAGHALAEARTGAGDQDALAVGVRHRGRMPSPAKSTLLAVP
jgi:hypothetical protein